ncbi:MAG: hypothetical protein HQ581_20425, partial [Planctomycetes bacterium]|nr:hypothetical protein [Planctomycetota bacterium]
MTLVLTIVFAVSIALFCGSTVQAATITAYYDFEGVDLDRFDDPAGAFADDLIGQRNPAFTGDVSGNAMGSTQAASFNGDSVLFTEAYSTDLGPDPDAWTIMFWVKGSDANQENNNTRLISTRRLPDGSSNPTKPSWQVEGFGNNGSNGDSMDVRFNSFAHWFNPDATNALANNGETEEWHHVAFVASNSGNPSDPTNEYAQTFVDGVSVGLVNMNYYTQSTTPNDWAGQNIGNDAGQLIIGGDAENAGSRAFSGLVDDFALFAGVVDSADIAAIAAGEMSPGDFIQGAAVPEPSTFALAA